MQRFGVPDSVIPVSHARMAHAAMPGPQLEIFEELRHFPFHDDPDRFVEIVERFIHSTEPAAHDQEYAARPAAQRTHRGHHDRPIDTRVAVLDAMGTDERSAT